MIEKPSINPFAAYKPLEAAKVMGVGKDAVYKALKNGELPYKEVGNGFVILGENLLRYLGSASYKENRPKTNYQSSAGVPAQN